MNKVLIALQGPINKKTLSCAKTFLKLNFQIVMISWPVKEFINYESKDLKIDFIDDPGTINDGFYGVNVLRQIVSNRYILDTYEKNYDYIIRLRNDIELTDSKQFKRKFNLAIKKDKIWTININTTSPRLLNPGSLPYHISDWFFGGEPAKLREFLQLENIDELKLIANKERIFKNLIYRRKAQNEQAIWNMAWDRNSYSKKPQLLINDPWANSSRSNLLKYASFLSDNFFITPFRLSGLQSIKYKVNIKRWYRSPYSLFILNNLEIYLINNNLNYLLIYYPPVLRYFLFKMIMIINKGKPISMR